MLNYLWIYLVSSVCALSLTFTLSIKLKRILLMTNKEKYDKLFNGSSVKRTKFEGLKRNINQNSIET